MSKLTPDKWPLLLKNYDQLKIRCGSYNAIPAGHEPMKRPLSEYIKYGCINLDKPSNPSSHEVVSWVKKFLNEEFSEITKTGHTGTLDPKVSGCLVVCIERATPLVKSQQALGKEYVAILKLFAPVDKPEAVKDAVDTLTGPLFQLPPETSAVKRQLRIRTIYTSELLEYDNEQNMAVIRVSCQAGTYIRTLCEHLGLLLGTGGEMAELRRIRSGTITEKDQLFTLHNLLDALYLYKHNKDESYLRTIVQPLEALLTGYKRIVVKDTAVSSICHGAQLTLPGVLRYDGSIDTQDDVVLMTTKGEAIALAHAVMTSQQIACNDRGQVTKTKRVIMDKDLYPKRWSLGPFTQMKKQLIQEGKLDEAGLPNENTPQEWEKYFDYGGNKWFYENKAALIDDLGKNPFKPIHNVKGPAKSKAKPAEKPVKEDSDEESSSDDSSSDEEATVNVEKKQVVSDEGEDSSSDDSSDAEEVPAPVKKPTVESGSEEERSSEEETRVVGKKASREDSSSDDSSDEEQPAKKRRKTE